MNAEECRLYLLEEWSGQWLLATDLVEELQDKAHDWAGHLLLDWVVEWLEALTIGGRGLGLS